MKILLLTNPDTSDAIPYLNQILASPHRLVGVIAPTRRFRGGAAGFLTRWRHSGSRFVVDRFLEIINTVTARWARRFGLRGSGPALSARELRILIPFPLFQPHHMDLETIQLIRTLDPDLILVCTLSHLLTPETLALPKYGCVNIHQGLLPEFRGRSSLFWSRFYGHQSVPLYFLGMTLKIDAGDVLFEKSVPAEEGESQGELASRFHHLGSQDLPDCLDRLEQGQVPPPPQFGRPLEPSHTHPPAKWQRWLLNHPPQRILILNIGGLGDLLLSLPALEALRVRFPKAFITLVTRTPLEAVAKRLPGLNDIRVVDLPRLGWGGRGIGFTEWLRLVRRLRRERYDLAINLLQFGSQGGALRMKWFFRATGARCRVGRNTESWGNWLNLSLPDYVVEPGGPHESENFLRVVRLVGALPLPAFSPFPLDHGDQTAAEHFLKKAGVPPDPLPILIHAGAGWPSRRWPIDSFAELIKKLRQDTPHPLILIGDQSEKASSKILHERARGAFHDAIGRLDVFQTASLMRRSRLLISNDGGPVHLASAVGTPVLAIFGPGDVNRFHPLSPGSRVIYKPVECSPCYYVECPLQGNEFHKCLRSITPEEVAEMALEMIQEKIHTLPI